MRTRMHDPPRPAERQPAPSEVLLNAAVHRHLRDGNSFRQISRETGIERHHISRSSLQLDIGLKECVCQGCYARLLAGQSLVAPTGRPPDVPRDLVESMKEERESEDLGLRGVDLHGLQAFVANKRQDYAVAHGGNPDVVPAPLPRSVDKRLRKEFAPDIGHGVLKPTERVMALNDFHNSVSHAAIAQNLVGIRPELFVNVDDTGLLLGTRKGEKPLLYSAAGIVDKLRQRGLQGYGQEGKKVPRMPHHLYRQLRWDCPALRHLNRGLQFRAQPLPFHRFRARIFCLAAPRELRQAEVVRQDHEEDCGA